MLMLTSLITQGFLKKELLRHTNKQKVLFRIVLNFSQLALQDSDILSGGQIL